MAGGYLCCQASLPAVQAVSSSADISEPGSSTTYARGTFQQKQVNKKL
jgi:hypothetical protein